MTAFAMDKPQRRAVSRALLPGGRVAPEHRMTTAAAARHLRGYLWVPCLLLLIALTGSAVTAAAWSTIESPVRWFWAAVAALVLGAAGVALYAFRKARAIVVDEFGG
jgi:hypothetical protein